MSKPLAKSLTANGLDLIAQWHDTGTLTLANALKGKQLSWYNREGGEENLLVAISSMVLSLARAYNIGKNIDEKQAAEIALGVIRKYWDLKLAELYLFVENAKIGTYGKVYDRFDAAVFFEWLEIYIRDHREVELERQHTERKHDQAIHEHGRNVIDVLTASEHAKNNPDKVVQLKDFGSIHRPNQKAIEVDERSRDEKNKIIQIQELRKWFPIEMNRAYNVAAYRYDRWGLPCTVDFILESRRVMLLRAKLKELKSKPVMP